MIDFNDHDAIETAILELCEKFPENKNPMNGMTCLYDGPNGTHCVIGQLLADHDMTAWDNIPASEIFKDQLRVHSDKVLKMVDLFQKIADNPIGGLPRPISWGYIPAIYMEKKASMTTRSPEREEFLADILITAVEGGTGYWAEVSNYSHTPAATACATLHEYHEEDDEGAIPQHQVDLETIEKGLNLYLNWLLKIYGEWSMELISKQHEVINNDAGEFDAEDADVIVQFAIFGEIKYA